MMMLTLVMVLLMITGVPGLIIQILILIHSASKLMLAIKILQTHI
ncbi:hypothetical protein ES703_36240 [subsurface metagenome]